MQMSTRATGPSCGLGQMRHAMERASAIATSRKNAVIMGTESLLLGDLVLLS